MARPIGHIYICYQPSVKPKQRMYAFVLRNNERIEMNSIQY